MSEKELPRVTEDGNVVLMPDATYSIKKVGNRNNAEAFNQDTVFAEVGKLLDNKVILNQPVFIGQFHSSIVRSIYIHKGEEVTELPEGFPVASDFKVPDLTEGDLLVATGNSIYWVTSEDKGITQDFGYSNRSGYGINI